MPSSEQGIDVKRFSVVPRSLIFLFNDQDQVLLIKGSPEKHIWADKYNGLGGHIEPGEDILEGALRELAEESGVKELPIWLCGQILVTVNQSQGVAILFLRDMLMQSKPGIHTRENWSGWVLMRSPECFGCRFI